MSFASIAIKTSIPVTAPAATSGALTFITIEDENWLQIIGDASAGSGSLYLLRWNPDLSVWHPYMGDKPIAVNSATLNGLFSAYYPFPKGDESFVLYDPTGTITATASAARTGSPLVAPTPASGGASGGATEAKQDTGNATLVSILGQLDSKTSTQATASAQTTGNNSLSSIDGKVATAAKQDTGNASLATIATQQTDGTQKTQVTSSALPTGAATAAKQPALGTAGTPSADVLSVQGVVGGTPQPISASSLPLPTGAATETTLALLTVAQNSTTGGQSGPLMMGAVTTSAPNYLNNRTQPFSLDTSGGMRVAGYNTPATAQANPTNAVPTQAFMMVWNGTTWDRLLSEGISADADDAPSAGTVSAESYNMAFNGTTWDRIRSSGDNGTNPSLGKQAVLIGTVATSPPSWTNGNIAPLSITPAGDARTVAKVTDGTNTATVKAASTAPTASDTALVATLSPNSRPGGGSSFTWFSTATGSLLKTGAGVVRRIIIGSNVYGTVTLHDNTSAAGTVITSVTSTPSTPCNQVELGVTFSTGLYCTTTGNGISVTVVYD